MVAVWVSFWKDLRFFSPDERLIYSPDEPETGLLMKANLMYRLDCLRGVMGKPFRINSGYRTPSHNKAVKGASRSNHMKGEAVDISTVGWSKEERAQLINLARRMGFRGVGVARTYIHLDVSARDAAWIYRDGKTPPIPVGSEADWV